jgi:hypothetical protein
MHKEKVLGMSPKAFLKINTKKIFFLRIFSLILILKNISNANLLDVFYR